MGGRVPTIKYKIEKVPKQDMKNLILQQFVVMSSKKIITTFIILIAFFSFIHLHELYNGRQLFSVQFTEIKLLMLEITLS